MSAYKTYSISGRTTDGNGDIIYPVSVDQMKAELNVEHSITDALILDKITEATDELERYLGLVFINATVAEAFDGITYPYPFFVLSMAPVITVDSFSYITGDVLTAGTASDFFLDTYGRPAVLQLKPNKSLPTTDNIVNRFQFTYTAGYGTSAADVPAAIKKAIKARVAASFEHRADRAKKYMDMSYSFIRNLKNSL